MEVIPDIKKSIGYINVNQALSDVFGENVSLTKYEGIGKGESDIELRNDFRMIWKYKLRSFVVWVGDTRTKGMMTQGIHGGSVNILIPETQKTEGWAPYIADDGVRFDDFEYQFPKNSEIWDILRYNNLGYDLETIKRCFQILKNYLDEQIRLKREEEDRNSFGF